MKIFVFILILIYSSISFSQVITTEVVHNGIKRKFAYHIPQNKKIDSVVFVLHGGGGDIKKIRSLTKYKFEALSDSYGYVLVYPQGYKNHFNDGRTGLNYDSFKKNIDDIGFFRYILNYLKNNKNLKIEKVYFTGISNGGLMSYRAACEMDEVDKIAPVVATMPYELYNSCKRKKELSVMIIASTKDPLAPYQGGYISGPFGVKKLGKVVSAIESYNFWVFRNNCRGEEVINEYQDEYNKDIKLIKKLRYCEKSKVYLYTLINAGHTWPGGTQYLPVWVVGKTASIFDASEEIISFFFDKI